MQRRKFVMSTFAAAAVAGLLATSGPAALEADPVKVGILIPLSGLGGLFGPSSQMSAQLAVEEINAAGGLLGRPIKPAFVDVGGPPADATQAALKLWKGQKAEAFIGMHDSAVRGALTNPFKGQVPYIYTPVYEGGECSPGTFVLGEMPSQQLEPVVPWLSEQKGIGKWYLIGNDYNWPRDTNAAAKGYIAAAGGTVVGEEYLPFTVDNFDSSLAKIKESGADGVLITLVGGASVGFNRAFASFWLDDQAVRLGTLIEENTLAGIGAENSKDLFSSAGYIDNIDNIDNIDKPAAKAFADKYKAKFGDDATALNALGQSVCDGVLLLDALARKAGSLDVSDMDSTAEGTSYEGPRGAASMSGRHVSKDVFLAEADGGGLKMIQTFSNVGAGDNCK